MTIAGARPEVPEQPPSAGQDGAQTAPHGGLQADATPASAAAGLTSDPSPENTPPEPDAPQRRWVWMDRWDPGTWEMPSNPTPMQRILAGVALVFIFVMTIYVPFKMLGVF